MARFRRPVRARSRNGLQRLAGLPDVAIDESEVPPLPASPNQPAALSLAALAAPPQPSDPAVLPPAPLPRLQVRLPLDLLSRDSKPDESPLAHLALAPWHRAPCAPAPSDTTRARRGVTTCSAGSR
jgi:hypothetical protein